MRISDWSSDVCSSDLGKAAAIWCGECARGGKCRQGNPPGNCALCALAGRLLRRRAFPGWYEPPHPSWLVALFGDRKSGRVGKECVSTCRSRWSPHHSKKTTINTCLGTLASQYR